MGKAGPYSWGGGPRSTRPGVLQAKTYPGPSFAGPRASLARAVWHPNWATVLPQNSSAVGSAFPMAIPLDSAPLPNAGLFLCDLAFPGSRGKFAARAMPAQHCFLICWNSAPLRRGFFCARFGRQYGQDRSCPNSSCNFNASQRKTCPLSSLFQPPYHRPALAAGAAANRHRHARRRPSNGPVVMV
jgi:hypothetical protein